MRAILDRENALGGELRLHHLAHAGHEQPDANHPENEPFADEKHDVDSAGPRDLPDHAARRQDEHQQNDGCQIHAAQAPSAVRTAA